LRTQIGRGANGDDPIPGDGDGSVLDEAQRAKSCAALRAAGEGEELRSGVEEEVTRLHEAFLENWDT